MAVITGGALCVDVDGQERVARRGDVVMVDADVVHAGHAPNAGHWKMRVAHVQPTALADYCERLGLARRDRFALSSPFIRDAQLAQDLIGIVRAVKRRLHDDLTAKLTPTLAAELGVPPFVLLRAFVIGAGLSPHAFQQQARVRRAAQLLRAGVSIAEAGADTGFADQAHFTRVFKSQVGVTPKMFQAAMSS